MCWHQDEMKVAVEGRRGGGEKGDSGRQINILQSLRSSLQLPMQPYTTVPRTGHWKHDSYCWKCCYMPMNSQTLWHPYTVCQKGNKCLLEWFTSNFICSIYAWVVPLIHDNVWWGQLWKCFLKWLLFVKSGPCKKTTTSASILRGDMLIANLVTNSWLVAMKYAYTDATANFYWDVAYQPMQKHKWQ